MNTRAIFTFEGTVELAKNARAARAEAASSNGERAANHLRFAKRCEREIRQRASWFERQAARTYPAV